MRPDKPLKITATHANGGESVESPTSYVDWEEWCDLLERLSLAHGFASDTVNSLFNPELMEEQT